MSKSYVLKAKKREKVGKGSARALRKEGLIPAVIYGNEEQPITIAVSYKEVYYKIYGGGFLTNIATLDLDGKKIQVLPKAYELDPVRDFPLHVDFLRINKNSQVNVKLPVHFLNEETCPGIKRGGVLNIVHHELECLVLASQIPSSIEVDLGKLQIGESVHLTEIKLPNGCTAISHEDDLTIATIAAPTQSDETEVAEVAAE